MYPLPDDTQEAQKKRETLTNPMSGGIGIFLLAHPPVVLHQKTRCASKFFT
jgi:hypothetical protein